MLAEFQSENKFKTIKPKTFNTMKTKTIILLGAVVIALSTAFAFNTNSTTTKTISKEDKTTSSNSTGGFALKDADQWK